MAGRFSTASGTLSLGMLIVRGPKALWAFVAVAVALHLSLTQLGGVEGKTGVTKPLTTQFVKRQPRLTKPLELKKRARPKPRAVRREMVAVHARVARNQGRVGADPVGTVRSLARARTFIGRTAGLGEAHLDHDVLAQTLESAKETEHVVDMSLELVDTEALDTGQYHAMVIQDPSDKRNIRGFFHFIQAYPASVVARTGKMNEFPRALRNLIERLDGWTDIRADVYQSVPFSSEEIFKVPFIYFDCSIGNETDRVSPAEACRLGEYMMRGGLYMAEDGSPGLGSATDKAARATIEDALSAVSKSEGRDWTFEKIPNDHGIYHCYYDFTDGPPTGADLPFGRPGIINGPFSWLEGVFVGGRLIAIMSNKAYQDVWSLRRDYAAFTAAQPRAFQMGINIIIFALTQEGSITNRVMDAVR